MPIQGGLCTHDSCQPTMQSRGRPGLQGCLAALLSSLTLLCLSQGLDILAGWLAHHTLSYQPTTGSQGICQAYKNDSPQYYPHLHCSVSNRVGLTYKVVHSLHPHINPHCGVKVGQAFGCDPSDYLYHFESQGKSYQKGGSRIILMCQYVNQPIMWLWGRLG